MIVGLFTDTYLPDVNGVVSSVDTLRHALESDGHEVYVICPKPVFDKIDVDDHVIRLPGIQIKYLYGYTLTSPWHYKAMKLIESLNLDIIHVHTEFGVGLFAKSVAKKLNIPIVATYHTFYEDYTHYVNPYNTKTGEKITRKAIISLSKYWCDSVEGIIAPTEKTKKRLEEYGVKTHISIVPTGLDLSLFSSDHSVAERPFSDDTFMLIYVGRIAEEKRIDFILKGLATMIARQMRVGLLVVGDGPGMDTLVNECVKLNITENVVFAGKIPHDNIVKYYREADAFISASLSETQGMTFIEAMAAGIPVLACDTVALKDVLKDGENGYYFQNDEELAEKVKLLMNRNTEEIKKMIESCKKTADEYSLGNFAREASHVYTDTILDYGYPYVISELMVNGDHVKVTVLDKKTETDFKCLAMNYFDLGYRIGQGIEQKDYDALKELHAYSFAYDKCIKKISYKDLSEQEIREFLDTLDSLSNEQIDSIVEDLKKQGFIDDDRLVYNQFEYLQMKLTGKKKIAYDLHKRGLSDELINAYSQAVNEDSEIERGVQKAEQLLRGLQKKSFREQLQQLRTKLISAGYEKHTIESIIAQLDLKKDEETENDNLKTDFDKVYKRYGSKYSGRILRQKVYTNLMSKGYNSDDVKKLIDNIEEADDENQGL